MIYRIGSRGSKLALAQTESVRERLAASFPDDRFEIVVITTKGDRVTDRPIASIGDNALFTREIERALAEGEIDLAVHSMKDLPSVCAEGLTLAKAWPREDPRDVLVLREGTELAEGAVVATGSPRRTLQLKRSRPDLTVVDIRGNVDTRLRKLFAPEAGEPRLDAIVLAAAGLRRLGRSDVITRALPTEEMLPAANQGQLAIEVRANDTALRAKLDRFGDETADRLARAERAFLAEIDADCHVPVAAYAVGGKEGLIRLRTLFAASPDAVPAFADVQGATAEEVARQAAEITYRRLAGEVTLVGAGPGDPDLITLKGLRAIRAADAIVYDRLSTDALLKEAKPGCETIYVGKASGAHTLPQERINALLAKLALAHRHVVRLKGGDSFVFGRGGEEMAYLAARGIRCSVVPGVTSSIAAPESARIPVTHRGVADGFEVITAHASGDAPLSIDFTRLLDTRKTLVFLMGLARIGEIAEGLMTAGRLSSTPAAVISSATLPAETCVIGTLDDIGARASSLPSPAVLVVGEVVRLRRSLGLPLSGRRLLVPRIEGGGRRVGGLLRSLGAEVDEIAVGRIVPIDGALTADDLADVTWLALTSRNALLPFDAALVDFVRARGIRVAAIGRATGKAAQEKGFDCAFVASESTGTGMSDEFASRLTADDIVLHPTAEGIDESLAALSSVCRLRTRAVYRNEPLELVETIDLARYDAVLCSCASSARRLFARAVGVAPSIAIGPATRQALESLGAGDIRIAREASAEGLAQAAVAAFDADLRDAENMVQCGERLP